MTTFARALYRTSVALTRGKHGAFHAVMLLPNGRTVARCRGQTELDKDTEVTELPADLCKKCRARLHENNATECSDDGQAQTNT